MLACMDHIKVQLQIQWDSAWPSAVTHFFNSMLDHALYYCGGGQILKSSNCPSKLCLNVNLY